MQPRLLRSPARLAGASLLRAQTDERLVALARDGHERAFAVIVERYRVPLQRYATRLVGPERGEDALQQAFLNAHTDLLRHPDRTIELRPWLYRIVHNASLNTLRSTHDEASLGEAAERLELTDDAVERRERLREALAAVAALPPQQRDAILLRELEGRSHEEIAHALGLSAGAARQQIFRARAALRAAVTAITPQPLLIRLLEAASAPSAGHGADLATAGASAGLSAVLAKAGATLVVGGAVVGGVVGTGAIDLPARDDGGSRPPAAIVERDRTPASAATPVAAAPVAGPTTSADDRGSASERSGPGGGDDDRGGGGSSGSGGDEDDGPGSDSSGPGPTGSGDDDRSGSSGKGKSGSGDPDDGDGDDRGGSSGSGKSDSGDDTAESGSGSGKGTSGGGDTSGGDSSGDGPSGGGSGDSGGGDGGGSGDSGGGGDDAADALTPQAPTADGLSGETREMDASGSSSGGGEPTPDSSGSGPGG